ncbi:MAG: terminase TerL endonuclease subunit [Pseudomonadota bacterium]|nr:terminase TerL endonuclease subunit [Pseudomonadota bacterium]
MSDAIAYANIAMQYATDVVDGTIDACIYVRQACQRHLNDLKRANNESGFEFEFNSQLAAKACRFIELLPHVKGELANKRELIFLEPWQIFIVANLFGWVDFDGKRRYRYAYVEVPRKNAKSTLAAGIGLYLCFADGEMGAEVYSAATTRDQARIVFETAQSMVRKRPDMQKAMRIEVTAHAVSSIATASTFKAVSRDYGGNLDGLNVQGAIIDELHAHKSNDTYEVMATGMGAREQPLLFAITTAGFILDGVCYEQRTLVAKVLSGLESHDRYFGIIYTIDDADDWRDPKSWRKANPNYGVSVYKAALEAEYQRAAVSPDAQADFLTKHLCVWVAARSGWLNMQDWDDAADKLLVSGLFDKYPCFGGLDLASKVDLASRVKLFVKKIDDISHYYFFANFYINRAQLDNANNPNQKRFIEWERQGWLTVTDGNITDFERIERDIVDDAANYDMQETGYDPFNATYLAMRLNEQGLNMVEVPQRVAYLSEPMKHLQALLTSKRVHHDGNPILRWCMGNVTVKKDANDNIFPRKESDASKIDGAVAAIIATNRAQYYDETGDLPSQDFETQLGDYLNDFVSFRG